MNPNEPKITPKNRVHVSTLSTGLKIYRVKLVGGPSDGCESLCSHDTVVINGAYYCRGKDDLYYYWSGGNAA